MRRFIVFLFFVMCTGTGYAATCAPGEYLNDDVCTQCDAGFYCIDDVRTPCPAGTFSTGGASDCITSDNGYHVTDCEANIVVPYGYTQLEYVANGGASYIDTGFIANQDSSVEVVFHLANLNNSDATILGAAGKVYYDRAFEIYIWNKSMQLNYGNQQLYATGHTMQTGNKYLATMQKNVLSLTNIPLQTTYSKTVSYTTFTGPLPVNLFRSLRTTTTTTSTKGPHAIYYVKFWDDDKLVRNMIPARRNSDGAVGMYDTVQNKFYENSGDDALIPGAVINPACTSQTICDAGYYCIGGIRYTCTNAPLINSTYTNNGWSDTQCPWVCNDGFAETSINTCGQICTSGATNLHTSTGVIAPLFNVANTTPAIHFQIGDNICHADLIPGADTGAINIEHDGQIYHTMNTNK